MDLNCLENNCWYHTCRPLIVNLHILLWLPVQKHALFKTLNSKIVKLYTAQFKTQDPENHTLFSGTYPLRQIRECLPSGHHSGKRA